MRTLIAIPCLDTVCTEFLSSILNLQCVGDVGFKITQATLIYEARNLLSQQAVREGYDRIMWLDSDMVFHPDVMARRGMSSWPACTSEGKTRYAAPSSRTSSTDLSRMGTAKCCRSRKRMRIIRRTASSR